MEKTDMFLIGGLLVGVVAMGLIPSKCPTGVLHPVSKAASDDVAESKPAPSPDATPSSRIAQADAEAASSPSRGDLTSTPPGVGEQGRSSAGGSPYVDLAFQWASQGELGVSMTPTPEGLFERSAVMWQLNLEGLTTEEARKLLPLDDNLPQMPGDLARALGGLPTMEDCETALRDGQAMQRLQEALSAELTLYALQGAPPSLTRDAAIEKARLAYERANERLYERLDEVTTYKNWSTMARLERAAFRFTEDW